MGELCKSRYWYCLRMSSLPGNLIDRFIDKVHDAKYHCQALSYRETAGVKLSPFYERQTLQHSFCDWLSVIGLSQCNKERKGISEYVCETTEISKGYSRANIAPDTACNSHFVPEEIAHVGSVPLPALTPQSQQQQQILPACNQISGDSKTHQTTGNTGMPFSVPSLK